MSQNEVKKLQSLSLLANIDWKNFVAGTAGGAFSTALFHPLDLIKIRWQVYENAPIKIIKITSSTLKAPSYRPKYKSLLDTVSSVYKSEHGIRGLYRGVIINTLASGSAWGKLSFVSLFLLIKFIYFYFRNLFFFIQWPQELFFFIK